MVSAAEYHALLAGKMTERELQDEVRGAVADLGGLYYHTWNSTHSPSGFPDCVIIVRSRILFRELKREGQDPTPKQREWLAALTAAGADAGVWRPADWYSGRITSELVRTAAA
jgi:hypothetical protein